MAGMSKIGLVEGPKFCKDCKWYKNGNYAEDNGKGRTEINVYHNLCIREPRSLDLVTGEIVVKKPVNINCYTYRDLGYGCEPEGIFWEAKDEPI